jgi:hypothetical protein
MGSSYLIAKAVIDAVDRLYVLRKGQSVEPTLASLIPVDSEDQRAFNLAPRDPVEGTLEKWMGWWHLYRSSYRLQAALFGTSTRQFLYLHKGELARALVGTLRADPLEQSDSSVRVPIELSVPRPSALGARGDAANLNPLMWRFGALVRDHRKRALFLHVDGYSDQMSMSDIEAFNGEFAPNVEIAVLHLPRSLTFDGMHLTATGSIELARVLFEHERVRDRRGP